MWTSTPNAGPPPRAASPGAATFTTATSGNAAAAVVRPLLRGSHHEAWRRASGARVGARQPPAVVAGAAVGDDVARHVLDDQIVAPHAEQGLRTPSVRPPPRRDPTTPPNSRLGERVLARAHRRRPRGFVVRPLQHGVLRLERRALRPARRRAPRVAAADTARRLSGPSQPPSHGSSPSAGTTSRSRARVAAT